MLTINVPLQSENVNQIVLTSNNAPITTYDEITRVQVVTPTLMLDSQTDPQFFDLTYAGFIVFKFGNAALPLGIIPAELRIFTLSNSVDGLFWSFFQMNVFNGGAI